MALNAAVVWEVRTTGADTNGGGFKAGATGTDRSQQDGAYATLTVLSLVHTTTTQVNVSLTDYTVQDPEDIGNVCWLSVNGGAFAAYEITVADEGNNRWTVDRSLGTAAQTVAGVMGGCKASPGGVGASVPTGGGAWLQTGTYSCSNTANVSNGRLNSSAANFFVRGYSTVRGDGGLATLQATANSVAIITTGNGGHVYENLVFAKSAAETGVVGITVSNAGAYVRNCKAVSIATGFAPNAYTTFLECSATSCTAAGWSGSGAMHVVNCLADTCANGFTTSSTATYVGCVCTNCTTNGFNASSNTRQVFVNCVAYNGTKGFMDSAATAERLYVNCLAWSNSTSDFEQTASDEQQLYLHCAGGATPTNAGADQVINFVTLTADPFVDSATNDFRLNTTAGGGAGLIGTGYPSAIFGLPNSVNRISIGALQNNAAVSSSGTIFAPLGSLGSGTNKTTQTTITVNTGINALAGQLLVVWVASDNEDTADGDTSLHTSLTIDGNGCTKIHERTNAQGSANAGVTGSLWYLIAPSDIANGSAILATLTTGKDAKALSAHAFDWDDTYTLTANQYVVAADDAADPQSMSLSDLPDAPHLVVRLVAAETASTTALTPSPGFTAITGTQTSGGADNTNIAVRGEYRLISGTTTGTSDPTFAAVDSVSILAVLTASLPTESGTANLLRGKIG